MKLVAAALAAVASHCHRSGGDPECLGFIVFVTYGLPRPESMAPFTPLQRSWRPKGRCKEGMRNSHAHSKPLELQLGGALGSLESKAPTFQIA